MNDQIITPATDIVREAEAISELTASEFTSPHKHFGDVVTAALDIIACEGLADDTAGDVDAFGHFARIDRWILFTATDGAMTHTEYATEALAIEAMANTHHKVD